VSVKQKSKTQTAHTANIVALIEQAKLLIIKIGSALLVQHDKPQETGQDILDKAWMQALSADIAAAHKRGQHIVLVSSGAVALGRGVLGLDETHLTLEQSQAAAAAGQIALGAAWQEAFGRFGLTSAQILLTPDDTERRRNYLNARSTLNTLLSLGVVPIINENDTVATQEIRYGDNDRLAARVASMLSADCLVLFSDIDGLYTQDPHQNPHQDPHQNPHSTSKTQPATHIAEVKHLTDSIWAMAGESSSNLSSGGMKTKLAAAQIAMTAGTNMILANGTDHHPLAALLNGANCTLFHSTATPHMARKRWIAASLRTDGRIHIDAGAEQALKEGRSLLPIGVTKVEGQFERGDTIAIYAPDGTEIARGLAEHAAEAARLFIGKQTQEIAAELRYKGRAEMIHRDNLVINDPHAKQDSTPET